MSFWKTVWAVALGMLLALAIHSVWTVTMAGGTVGDMLGGMASQETY